MKEGKVKYIECSWCKGKVQEGSQYLVEKSEVCDTCVQNIPQPEDPITRGEHDENEGCIRYHYEKENKA